MKKFKRIALVQPNLLRDSFPLGLLCIGSYIEKYGYQPIVLDLGMNFGVAQIYSPDFFRQAAEKIMSHGPQAVGFTTMDSTLPVVLLIAKECKKIDPHLPVILGGPGVSFDEEDVLKTFDQVDFIVRGEGEITFLELLEALEEKRTLSSIAGISFRRRDVVVRNPDRPHIDNLDDLPFVNFYLLPEPGKYRSLLVEAGRGCPFRCTFCSTCQMWKMNYRIKSPQRLLEEMKLARRMFKTNITIIHDNLFTSKAKAEELLSLLIKEDFVWACSLRFDFLDEELIKKLKRAGCNSIFLGIESGSPGMQKKIRKNLRLSMLPEILDLLRKNGIRVCVTFILGFPDETEVQFNENLREAFKLKAQSATASVETFVGTYIYTFLKGSELYSVFKSKFGKAEFWEPDSSPFVTCQPEEVSLVKKYPYIFPSFYYVRGDGIDPKMLRKLCRLFHVLIKGFPRTTFQLFGETSDGPFKLGQQILNSFEKVDKNKLGQAAFLRPRHFAAFVAFVINRNSSKLMSILAEELSCYGLKLSDYLTITPENDKVILRQGVLGKTMALDKKIFDEVVENLNQKASTEIEKTKKELMEIMAVVPAGVMDEKKLAEEIIINKFEKEEIVR